MWRRSKVIVLPSVKQVTSREVTKPPQACLSSSGAALRLLGVLRACTNSVVSQVFIAQSFNY